MATRPPALQIERVQLDTLHLDPANARAHGERNLAAIRNSLERFGQQKPIVVDAKGGVVAGNGTLEAARQLGWKTISVVRTSLAGQERVAFAIADNRSAELAAWDPDNLEAALSTLDADLRELVDINDEELRRIAEAPPPSDELGDGDNGDAEDHAGALAESFGAPPFSILDARQGWWQRRKSGWIGLGIQSELGRGCNALDFSSAAQRFGFKRGDRPGLMMHGQDSLNRLLRGRNRAAAVPGGNVGKNSCWLGSDSKPAVETGLSGTSIFDPVLCELVYRWFCPPGGLVVDPFAGGSVRGIVAARLGRHYTGIDLREEQVAANEKQAATICRSGIMPRWLVGDSRDVATLALGKYDLLFSCPPYGSLEVYGDDPRDLSNMSWPAFCKAYRAIILASAQLLKPDRFACFVVGNFRRADGGYNDLVAETCRAFEAGGLAFYNEAVLVTVCGSLPLRVRAQFEGSRKLGKSHQNILIFVKGDPRRATAACGECAFGRLETEPLPGEPGGGS